MYDNCFPNSKSNAQLALVAASEWVSPPRVERILTCFELVATFKANSASMARNVPPWDILNIRALPPLFAISFRYIS